MRALWVLAIVAFLTCVGTDPVKADLILQLQGDWESRIYDSDKKDFDIGKSCREAPLRIRAGDTDDTLMLDLPDGPTVEAKAYSQVENTLFFSIPALGIGNQSSDPNSTLWVFTLAYPDVLLWFKHSDHQGKDRIDLDVTWHRCDIPTA